MKIYNLLKIVIAFSVTLKRTRGEYNETLKLTSSHLSVEVVFTSVKLVNDFQYKKKCDIEMHGGCIYARSIVSNILGSSVRPKPKWDTSGIFNKNLYTSIQAPPFKLLIVQRNSIIKSAIFDYYVLFREEEHFILKIRTNNGSEIYTLISKADLFNNNESSECKIKEIFISGNIVMIPEIYQFYLIKETDKIEEIEGIHEVDYDEECSQILTIFER